MEPIQAYELSIKCGTKSRRVCSTAFIGKSQWETKIKMEIRLGKIKVEPQDIASGNPEDPFECAIAHALHRKGYVDPIVRFMSIEIHENETEYLCSDAIADWQSNIIEGELVDPITLIFDEKYEGVYLESEYQQQ